LLDPIRCKKIKCKPTKPKSAKGKTKCNAKKRFSVGLSTEKPPHNQNAISCPITGMALNKFVITVAPQKLICPHGRTYPINAIAIINAKISIPLNQTNGFRTYEK